MKISALRLFNVKRFADRGVAIEGIDDGVNVLCAVNEFGKSTSFEALHALFFQPYSGTPNDVKALRPYSGGNPLVEVDIATAEGRFRITKQYYGGRFARVADLATGRLIAQADEAENFISGLVKGGAAGPAGLLWVRQGVTGVERRSRSEEDSEKQVRAGLLESVQGEVEAVTGGRRMAEIMAAAEEDLAKLVTPTGRAKTGGRYAAAIETRDRLDAERQKLWADVVALREGLDRRTSAMKRLAELDNADDRRARRTAIETAQANYDAAKSQGEKLRTAEAELRLSRERRDTTLREFEAFRTTREKSGHVRESLGKAELRRGDAVSKRQGASTAIDKAREDAEAAEAEEREARDLLARLDAALQARENTERLGALKERLNEAKAVRLLIEHGEAKLALTKIPPAAIEELQTLDIELAKLRATDAMSRPSVSVAYDDDSVVPVAMDGAPLASGEERSYAAQARLIVQGVGTIILRSNIPVQADKRLAQAEAKHRTLLEAMGVADLASARVRQATAQQLDSDLRDLRGRLALLAPEGLPALRGEIASRVETIAAPIELKAEPDQVRAALAAAGVRRQTTRQALREAEPLQRVADDAYVSAETALAALQAEQSQIDAVLGPEPERDGREHRLSEGLNALQEKLAAAESDIDALRATAVDPATAEATLKRARSVDQGAEQEINRLREEIAGLNAGISARCDEAVEEKWRETDEALSAAEERVQAFAREAAMLQRLSSALALARSDARELYLKPVMKELTPLLALLFDDVSITFDEKTLLPDTIQRHGLKEDIDRLSGGMKEQLSVLTRLAFARLLARDRRPTPVILDDALVYSDDDRIEKMFDALHRQSKDQQIIVFSCRQRAFQKLGGNVLEMTDWRPSS